MRKFWVGVYVGASAILMWGMFIELQRMTEMINNGN